MSEQPQCNWLKGNPFEAMEVESQRRKHSEQPQIEAINAADKCCNWLQSDDDPIGHEERMTCAKFIQAAIDAALATERERYMELDDHCCKMRHQFLKAEAAIENLHKILGQKRTRIRELQQQLTAEERRANDSIEENVRLMNRLAAERDNAEAWRLVAKGKEGAYVKMEQQLADERKRLDWVLRTGILPKDRAGIDAALAKVNLMASSVEPESAPIPK